MEPFHQSPLNGKQKSKLSDDFENTRTVQPAGLSAQKAYDQDSILENIPEMDGLLFDERVEILNSLLAETTTTIVYTAGDHAYFDRLGETQGD